MFSFRTTPLQDQLDKALIDGKVGCFCTQNCWDTSSDRYMYQIFKERGNLERLFQPEDAELTPGTSLEDIYTRFNIDHPKDFKGHSLSVSDVVVLHQNGQDAAHYVDSFGYKEVPEFLQEQTQQPEKINPLKHVEDTIEQNDNNFDGIINNTPTVDELEAKVKAGEQISLVDLAEAIKADKERGKEKPSIRAQLKADKERTGKKKNAKQKSQDLERS